MSLFILIFFNLFAYVGHDLPVDEVVVEELQSGASCLMLKHRHKERQRVIREMEHIMNVGNGSFVQRLVEQDTLLVNKFFLDPSVWQDESIQVSFKAQLSIELKEEIQKIGFTNIFISIEASGLKWNSRVNNTPDSLKVVLTNDEQIDVNYQIYRSDLCFLKEMMPRFSWVSDDEDLSDVFDSHKALQELELLLN